MSPLVFYVDQPPPDAFKATLRLVCKFHPEVELARLWTTDGTHVDLSGDHFQEQSVGSWRPTTEDREAAERLGLMIPEPVWSEQDVPVHFVYTLACPRPSCSHKPALQR